jgi:hypothetical protein
VRAEDETVADAKRARLNASGENAAFVESIDILDGKTKGLVEGRFFGP